VSGIKTKRLIWTIVFLGVTLVAIVMEVAAGMFHVAGTIPWTEYIARYVPWPIQLIAYVALAVWLPFHFWRHDHARKVAYRQGYQAAQRDAIVRRGAVPGEPVHPTLSEPHQDLL
jgi:putative Ca2+/H+ antiporter (TMEM165/GDT1 family)